MKYCSECGTAIARQWVAHEEQNRYMCTACGKIHYQNPHIVVCSIVCWQDKVLMCRRSQAPAIGHWAIPSGFLECGETLEEGAARETLEETGLVIDPARFELCSVMNMTSIEQIAIAFRVQFTDKPVVYPGPECMEVAFLSEDEVPKEQFAWRETMGGGPQHFTSELRSGRFSIQLISIGSDQGRGFKARRYMIESIISDYDAEDNAQRSR